MRCLENGCKCEHLKALTVTIEIMQTKSVSNIYFGPAVEHIIHINLCNHEPASFTDRDYVSVSICKTSPIFQ